MTSLPTTPLQVNDFSGGITENFIQGGITRYMSADNLLITVDRKLEEREGSQILDAYNYMTPSANLRIGAFLPFDEQQYLIAQQGPYLYWLNPLYTQIFAPSWASILGPTGNPPLASGTALNQVSSSEWQHQLAITNDSLITKPIKIYRDSNNTFQCRTLGLPSLVPQQNLTDLVIFNEAVTLSTQLKNQLAAHFLDHGVLNTNLHAHSDFIDFGIIMGAPFVTDQATLFLLCAALAQAYTGHVNDVTVGTFAYHFNWQGVSSLAGLNRPLITTVTPTTLIQAAAMLDDLKQKFLFHEMALATHSSTDDYGLLGVHLVTTPHIGTISTGPILTPNYSQTITLVNAAKAQYNAHIADVTYHFRADTFNTISFPDALDFDTLTILVAYLLQKYQNHFSDSLKPHTLCSVTSVNTTPNLTSIVIISNGQTPGTAPGPHIYDPAGTVFPTQPVNVIASGLGTATASVNASSSQTGYTLDFTSAFFHVGVNANTVAESLQNYLMLSGVDLTTNLFLLDAMLTAFNQHDSDSTVHNSSVQHQITTTIPLVASYAYAFHYFYTYTLYTGIIYNVVGPPVLVGPVQTEVIQPANGVNALSTLTISNLVPLANGAGDNYDVANIQIKLFRTENAQTTYFQVGIVTNGTTTYTDNTPDLGIAALPSVVPLVNQPKIYTSGNVVNFDQSPIAKCVHIINNTAYFGAIIDTGQTFLNRVRQSIQNNIDSSPGSFFDDLEDQIVGINSVRGILIYFCKSSLYRGYGGFNLQGQGQMNHERLSDTVGCISGASIVRTDAGLFFAGTDGFYFTDGFQLVKLSSEFNKTYVKMTKNASQQRGIYGCFDNLNRRVWWSMQPDPSDRDVSKSYIFDLNFGTTAQGAFTTASNGENYRPSAMIFYNGLHLRGDSRGFIFQHGPFFKTDPIIKVGTAGSTWNTTYIPYLYASCALDFGTTFQRKWTPWISVQGKDVGNVGAGITSISDNGRVPVTLLAPIWYHPNIYWGQPNLVWGAPNSVQPIIWNPRPEMDMRRRFPATQLRSDFKQILIQPTKIGVYRYEDWPIGALAVITAGGSGSGTATIQSPSPYTAIVWPLDVVGYVLSVQSDNYTAEYAITAVSGNQLTYADPGNVLQTSTVSWVIRGILKAQKISLTSYNIHFSLLGKMQQAYGGPADSGENT